MSVGGLQELWGSSGGFPGVPGGSLGFPGGSLGVPGGFPGGVPRGVPGGPWGALGVLGGRGPKIISFLIKVLIKNQRKSAPGAGSADGRPELI